MSISAPAYSFTPVLGEDSAYTLTEVENSGTNIVSSYVWDEAEAEFSPVNYRVDLKSSDYGHPDVADEIKNFTINVANPSDVANPYFHYEINYYVDNSRLQKTTWTPDVDGLDFDKDIINTVMDVYAGVHEYANVNNNVNIGHITGDFINNSRLSNGTSWLNISPVFNSGSIQSIDGNFINNSMTNDITVIAGGGILNFRDGYIGSISAKFINNSVHCLSTSGHVSTGGAIYNNPLYFDSSWSIIDTITADFIGNSASSLTGYSYGGAIYNEGQINSIVGDFIGNSAISEKYQAYGGAIYASYRSKTGSITGSFINNYTKSPSDKLAVGGAIYAANNITITAQGKAIEFTGNYTEDLRGRTPNAIFVDASYTNHTLTLDATNNGTITFNDQIDGGVINGLTIERIKQYTLALTGDKTGTISFFNDIINANVTSENITINFANNDVKNYEFVSMTAGENTKMNLDINLNNNSADKITTTNSSNGIITLNLINFTGKYSGIPTIIQLLETPTDTLQLALSDNLISIYDLQLDVNTLYNDQIVEDLGAIELATTDTTNDSIKINGQIYDGLALLAGKESTDPKNFIFRTTDEYKVTEAPAGVAAGEFNIVGLSSELPSTINANGLSMFALENETALSISNTIITNAKDYAIKAENANSIVNLTNTSFQNTAGTAIISNVDLQISANNGKSEFSNNTSAILMNDSTKTISLNAINNGEILLNDKIEGANGYKIIASTDQSSQITINNNINNAQITFNNANISLTNESALNNAQSVTLNDSNINMLNNSTGTMYAPSLSINGTTKLSLDVDLENGSMDRISADSYAIAPNALIDITNLNLITTTEKSMVKILFADSIIANIVKYTGETTLSVAGTLTVYSPIYKYNVSYGTDPIDSLGYFTFARQGGGLEAFNPAALVSPFVQLTGAYITQLQIYNYAFQHSDRFMNLPSNERMTIKNRNKYALSPTSNPADTGNFSPLYTKEENEGFWVKPYASFENVPLSNGPKVSNINYGTLIGHDGDLTPVKFGFERVITSYIGYNGASQRYQGIDAFQNGGIIGQTITLYKNNFFNATTINTGATSGDARTMYGSENYTMLTAGIANKTGYNIEFKEGKYIIQPSMLISYTFVNTFDYNNGAGVKIKSDPLNAIQLAPGIKFIMNTKSGWQPYLGVTMVWNILDKTSVNANETRLPSMSIDPYIQYGIGVQKRWKDSYTAYCQAMIHNGGRNGISLTAGLRWEIGRKNK